MSKLIDKFKINAIYKNAEKHDLDINKYAIETLYNESISLGNNQKWSFNFLNDVKKSKNPNMLNDNIRKNVESYANLSNKISLNIILYTILESYSSSPYFTSLSMAQTFLSHNYDKSDMKYVVDNYGEVLTNYISSDNKLKNKLMPISQDNIRDYTKEFDLSMFKKLFDDAMDNNPKTYSENLQFQTFFNSCLIPFLSIYSKEDLINKKEFIKYEMRSGVFDELASKMKNGETIPSNDYRENRYNREKKYTTRQIKVFNEADVLKEKIELLYNSKAKEKLLIALDASLRENDYEKVEKVYDYYKKISRKEIIDSLYSPQDKNITILENFENLENIMIHSFLRDSNKILQQYENDLKSKIIESRKDHNTDKEFTEKEQRIFDGKMKKAKEVLANQVITDKTFDIDLTYSDANGLLHYKSNTSNQLSVSLMSPENILKMSTSMGIGFDQKGIDIENILFSSTKYMTTNKGLNNIELDDSELNSASQPLNVMENSSRNEILMERNKENNSVKPSYIYVALSGKKNDNEVLEKAKKFAHENKLPLIIFDVEKLNKSYENQKLNSSNKR